MPIDILRLDCYARQFDTYTESNADNYFEIFFIIMANNQKFTSADLINPQNG